MALVNKTLFTYQTNDGTEIYANKWKVENEETPRAIVQIAHGMAEHIERYNSFSNELISHNLFVYGNDHRGHGKTGTNSKSFGYFADEHGFEKVVNDMSALTNIIKMDYPDIPIILFGHSMGSFLSRRYIQLHGDRIDGVILSGTGGDPGLMGKIGRMIAKREMKKNGPQTPSPLMNKLTFGSYNKGFAPTRTEFDWLSRDAAEVDKYIEDPFCGGVFTAGFFNDLLEGIEIINNPSNIAKIPMNLPIYLLSGSKDPVGRNTKGVMKTYQAFIKAGIRDVTYKLYDNARHEILNEINRDEVAADIIHWISDHIK